MKFGPFFAPADDVRGDAVRRRCLIIPLEAICQNRFLEAS